MSISHYTYSGYTDWADLLEKMRKDLEPKEVEKRRLRHWIDAKKKTRDLLDKEIAKLEEQYSSLE